MDEKEYKKSLAVRIALESIENLVGSGVLYISHAQQMAVILTAAHVIKDLFKENPNEADVVLTFSNLNNAEIYHKWTFTLKQISSLNVSNPSSNVFNAVIHKEYDSQTHEFDAGLMVCPYEQWMEDMKGISFAEKIEDDKQFGWGFPAYGTTEKEGHGLSGIDKFEGTVSNIQLHRYTLRYSVMGMPSNRYRYSSMQGFSGSGAYQEKSKIMYLAGIVSCLYGDEKAGPTMWMTSSSVFKKMLEQCGLISGLPQSLNEYESSVCNKVDEDFHPNARRYVEDCLGKLIYEKGLSAKDFTDDGVIPLDMLPCNCGERKDCSNYWEGQLEKAICFCDLFKTTRNELAHPSIPILSDVKKAVKAEFLCSSLSGKKILKQLLEECYFSKHGIGQDNTIFLLNHKDHSRNEVCKRKNCQNILVDIANDDEYKGYSGRQKYRERTEKFASNEKEDVKFDIINGEVGKCNLAFIGMGRLQQCITDNDGNAEKIKQAAERLFQDTWG